MRLLHVFLHVLDRLAKVVRNPNLTLHVTPVAFPAFDRGGFEFGDGFAALGDNERLPGASLAQEAGQVCFGLVSADFLHAGSGFHKTSLLNRPVVVKSGGDERNHNRSPPRQT